MWIPARASGTCSAAAPATAHAVGTPCPGCAAVAPAEARLARACCPPRWPRRAAIAPARSHATTPPPAMVRTAAASPLQMRCRDPLLLHRPAAETSSGCARTHVRFSWGLSLTSAAWT